SQAPKNTFLKKIECTAKMGKISAVVLGTALKNKGKRKSRIMRPGFRCSVRGLFSAFAAPVPVALRPDIDVNRSRVAIGADAATSRHGAGKTGNLPFGNAVDLDVGCGADHMKRFAGTVDLAIIGWAAIARSHHDWTAEMPLHGFQHGNELRFEAGDIHGFALHLQAVRRKAGKARS